MRKSAKRWMVSGLLLGLAIGAAAGFKNVLTHLLSLTSDHALMALVQCSDRVQAYHAQMIRDAQPFLSYAIQASDDRSFVVNSQANMRANDGRVARVGFQCQIKWNGDLEIIDANWAPIKMVVFSPAALASDR